MTRRRATAKAAPAAPRAELPQPPASFNDAWSAYHQLMAETAEREKAEAERTNEALRDKARKRAAAEKKRSGWAKWGDSLS
jgi:hypothetical protein